MSHPISRRNLIRSVAAAGALALATPFIRASDPAGKPVRMGFIGVGSRGSALLRQILQRGDVTVPALCDIDPAALERGLKLVQSAARKPPRTFTGGAHAYRGMLEMDELDCVLIATPQDLHAGMSIDSLRAGKFVGSEVPAAVTVEESQQLIEVQRQTGTGYMMLENCLYWREIMQVQNMADKGLFGELTYAFGSYIHEIRNLRFNDEGALTWRGEAVRDHAGLLYTTHAMGPICRWLGINKDDALTTLVAMSSQPASLHEYAAKRFGAQSPAGGIKFTNADTNHALMKTRRGRLIELRYDTHSPRPAGNAQYSLQGTRGAYESVFGQRMVYIEGRSQREQWEPLETYAGEFEHPRWKAHAGQATGAGHGGADYFVLDDFVTAVRTGRSPIDVLDSITWSLPRPLSASSLANGSKPVAFPDLS